MNFWKKSAVGLMASALLFSGGMSASQAASTAPTAPVNDPGPAGDFSWKGYNWDVRDWAGAPQYNGLWSASNVSKPDSKGYVKLTLSNPTGKAPVGAEFQSTKRGFGYGTYSTVVEKNLSVMQKEVVWGCLFTYDPDTFPGHNEIDLCEASAWGGGAAYREKWPVTQAHGYWFDATKAPGQGNAAVVFPVSNISIQTHKMIWEPGKITFETYAGEGFKGTLLKRTVLSGANVPVPSKERVHFNLWAINGGGGNPAVLKPESVTVRDFTFTPRVSTSTSTSTPVVESSPKPATSLLITKPKPVSTPVRVSTLKAPAITIPKPVSKPVPVTSVLSSVKK